MQAGGFPSLSLQATDLYGAAGSTRVGEPLALSLELEQLDREERAFAAMVQSLVRRPAPEPIGVKFHRPNARGMPLAGSGPASAAFHRSPFSLDGDGARLHARVEEEEEDDEVDDDEVDDDEEEDDMDEDDEDDEDGFAADDDREQQEQDDTGISDSFDDDAMELEADLDGRRESSEHGGDRPDWAAFESIRRDIQ